MRARLVTAVLLCLAAAAPLARAQQSGALEIPPPILTIDQDRLFNETEASRPETAKLTAEAESLAAENKSIEASLTQEEKDLTEKRKKLPPDEFRKLADAFDAKVQRIRGEQDQKARDLTQKRDELRQQVLKDAAKIISQVVRERGALVVLDRRNVFLSADRIDITDEVIKRMTAGTQAN